MFRLDPHVLDEARRLHGLTSDEKLAHEIEMSGTSIRDLRQARTGPTVGTLMKLRKLTGLPLEAMILEQSDAHEAA